MTDVLRSIASHAELADDGVIRGVASSIGNVDRARRVFLPGAFGSSSFQVPLLAYHDDKRPLGSSTLIPSGSTLRHESRLANISEAGDIRELIRAGGIPATSIGWISHSDYYGWKELEKAEPQLASLAANHGIQPREDVVYFAKVEVVENSLVPVPANPLALISAASLMLAGSPERALLEDMIEMAKGSRHNQADQAAIQGAHDLMSRLGAVCLDDDEKTPGAKLQELETAADKPKYAMADGSYPINACTGENSLESEAKLAHHSKTYSFEEVKAHVLHAAKELGCDDEVLPATWKESKSDDAAVPSLEVQLAALDPDLAQLEEELNQLSSGH